MLGFVVDHEEVHRGSVVVVVLILNLDNRHNPLQLCLWELLSYVRKACSEVSPGPTNRIVGRCTKRYMNQTEKICRGVVRACCAQLNRICLSTDARTSEYEASALPVQNEASCVALVQSWRQSQHNSC